MKNTEHVELYDNGKINITPKYYMNSNLSPSIRTSENLDLIIRYSIENSNRAANIAIFLVAIILILLIDVTMLAETKETMPILIIANILCLLIAISALSGFFLISNNDKPYKSLYKRAIKKELDYVEKGLYLTELGVQTNNTYKEKLKDALNNPKVDFMQISLNKFMEKLGEKKNKIKQEEQLESIKVDFMSTLNNEGKLTDDIIMSSIK